MKSITEKYVEDVLRTEPSVEDYEKIIARIDVKTMRLLHAAMGLCTEAGEFMDQIKKHIMYGVELDEINLIEELGDGNWYEGIALDTLMFSMAEVLHRNIAKLKARFPEKFTEEGALNRDLEKERNILNKDLAVMCEHANEVPLVCQCDSSCYCKTHTCCIHYRIAGGSITSPCGIVATRFSYSPREVSCEDCRNKIYD